MQLTVLGNNGPFPAAGGACSGYLLKEGDIRVLIDCGSGVLANLLRFENIQDIDAIILTHLHSDHMSDMMVLRYAIQIKRKLGTMNKGIIVYAPDKPEKEFQSLDISNIFNLNAITQNMNLKFGNIKVTFKEMIHPVKSFAVSFDNTQKRFVFSGDTSWNEDIIKFGRNTDFLMLDSGLAARDKKDNNVPHLTASECGMIAEKASVKKLMLTHFMPEYDTTYLKMEALRYFNNVEVSEILKTYKI